MTPSVNAAIPTLFVQQRLATVLPADLEAYIDRLKTEILIAARLLQIAESVRLGQSREPGRA